MARPPAGRRGSSVSAAAHLAFGTGRCPCRTINDARTALPKQHRITPGDADHRRHLRRSRRAAPGDGLVLIGSVLERNAGDARQVGDVGIVVALALLASVAAWRRPARPREFGEGSIDTLPARPGPVHHGGEDIRSPPPITEPAFLPMRQDVSARPGSQTERLDRFWSTRNRPASLRRRCGTASAPGPRPRAEAPPGATRLPATSASWPKPEYQRGPRGVGHLQRHLDAPAVQASPNLLRRVPQPLPDIARADARANASFTVTTSPRMIPTPSRYFSTSNLSGLVNRFATSHLAHALHGEDAARPREGGNRRRGRIRPRRGSGGRGPPAGQVVTSFRPSSSSEAAAVASPSGLAGSPQVLSRRAPSFAPIADADRVAMRSMSGGCPC